LFELQKILCVLFKQLSDRLFALFEDLSLLLYLWFLTCIIHKLSITMLNYRQNTSVRVIFGLKIVHYFLLQICLQLLAFFDI
jgi:hypothetical protein